MRDCSRFKGCLLGGAVGDALGYAVEFMSKSEIVCAYGPQGITRYEPRAGKAQISDDTQMTLFTAVGLLYGRTCGGRRGIGAPESEYIRLAYLDWLDTQTRILPCQSERTRISWLANLPAFYHRRAPGITCLSALESGGKGTIEKPINNSKGCGGVMRVAPIGLFFCDKAGWTKPEIDMLGAEAAAITHGHELGYIPAAALVHIVRSLASGEHGEILSAVREAMAAVQTLFPDAEHMEHFQTLMQRAIELSQEGTEPPDAFRSLGGGWVAEETLAIAVYCALKYPHDFEKAIVASVNHSGDSDSTGAVTGNILGAALGLDAIPDFYLQDLELRDVIEEIAEDLCTGCGTEAGSEEGDPAWVSKYIRVDYDEEKRKQCRRKQTNE